MQFWKTFERTFLEKRLKYKSISNTPFSQSKIHTKVIVIRKKRAAQFPAPLCMQVPSKNSERNLIRIMFLLWDTQICAGRMGLAQK